MASIAKSGSRRIADPYRGLWNLRSADLARSNPPQHGDFELRCPDQCTVPLVKARDFKRRDPLHLPWLHRGSEGLEAPFFVNLKTLSKPSRNTEFEKNTVNTSSWGALDCQTDLETPSLSGYLQVRCEYPPRKETLQSVARGGARFADWLRAAEIISLVATAMAHSSPRNPCAKLVCFVCDHGQGRPTILCQSRIILRNVLGWPWTKATDMTWCEQNINSLLKSSCSIFSISSFNPPILIDTWDKCYGSSSGGSWAEMIPKGIWNAANKGCQYKVR